MNITNLIKQRWREHREGTDPDGFPTCLITAEGILKGSCDYCDLCEELLKELNKNE